MSVVGVARSTFSEAPASMRAGSLLQRGAEKNLAGQKEHHHLRRGLELLPILLG